MHFLSRLRTSLALALASIYTIRVSSWCHYLLESINIGKKGTFMDTCAGINKLACSCCLLIYFPNTTTKSDHHNHHNQVLSILASTLEHSHISQYTHLSTIHLIHKRRQNASFHKPLTFSNTYKEIQTHITTKENRTKTMTPTRNATFAQWADQTYGPSFKPTLNTQMISDVEYLVCVKYLKDLSESGLVFPAKHPSTPDSFFSTSPSVYNAFHFGAITQTTTPAKTTPAKTNTTPLEIDQLEYLVNIKIENFREHVRVHIPLDSHQSRIDREEEKRRRMFFEKNGEEAYRVRYIDSDYSGHVEFLYIDPAEVQWKRIV